MSVLESGFMDLRFDGNLGSFQERRPFAEAARAGQLILDRMGDAHPGAVWENFVALQEKVNDLIWAIAALEFKHELQRDAYQAKIDRLEDIQNDLLWRVTGLENT